MAFAFGESPFTEGTAVKTHILQTDYNGDTVKKVNLVLDKHDITAAGESSIELFWRAYELVSDAALSKVSASLELTVSGQNVTPATGLNAKISDRLVLWFYKEHPLNPTKTVWASFVIVAPVNAIVVAGGADAGAPIMTREVSLTDVASALERLGAIVDYLEEALRYTDVADVPHDGGWTYSPDDSHLVTVPRKVGGSPID